MKNHNCFSMRDMIFFFDEFLTKEEEENEKETCPINLFMEQLNVSLLKSM